MQQSSTLYIYPTSRALRIALESTLSTNQILPKYLTIGDFEQKVVLVKNRIFIDDDTRVLLLNKACSFDEFTSLKIPKEFLSFFKNSKFIFSFLDELANEYVDIDSLFLSDTYCEFEEHLTILEMIKKNYIKLLDDNNYVDKMLLPNIYTINKRYIANFEKIVIYLEGYLSNFEFKLLEEISNLTTIEIVLKTTKFNQKIIQKFATYDIDLAENFNYIIDFSTKSIVKSKKLSKSSSIVEVEAFSQSIMQVAFIKKNIYKLLNQGYSPLDIVIVLPDKAYADVIENFDYEKNLNFAFGFSFKKTQIYKKIEAIYLYISEYTLENLDRLKRLFEDSDKLIEKISSWKNKKSLKEIEEIFEFLTFKDKEEVIKIFDSELYLFKKILASLKDYPFSKILFLFLNRLSTKSIDDVRGGKITVLEILETRGVNFKAVILVNFNEGVVPKQSKKDMFISSKVRDLSNLPTSHDRQNLQKFYYQNLILGAEKVSISYINDEQNSKSRFLDELGFDYQLKQVDPKNYQSIFFKSNKPITHKDSEEITLDYDFTKVELSASRLKCFLDCKRKYYYKYIKKIKEAEIPINEVTPQIVGNLLHDALFKLYEKKKFFHDSSDLLLDLQRFLYENSEKNLVLKFNIDLWLKRFHNFASVEVERFRSGFKVFEVEKSISIDYKGLKLIGKIDRIDIKDNRLYVLDYKSGKIPKTSKSSLENSSDFQLQFYYHLTSSIKDVYGSYYYDLTNSILVDDNFFEQKLKLLDDRLEELKQPKHSFNKTDDIKKCLYCPYKIICNRLN